jgi:hypothetical protein
MFEKVREGHCEPVSAFKAIHGDGDGGGFSSKRRALHSFLSTFPLSWNVHFVPQALYCDGLFRRAKDYEFVGSMEDYRFKPDMQRLMRSIPINGSPLEKCVKKAYPFLNDEDDGNSTTSFRVSLLQNGVGHATHTPGRVLEFYNADSVRMALQYYSIDYVTLNLTIPKWVQDILDQDCQQRYHYYYGNHAAAASLVP